MTSGPRSTSTSFHYVIGDIHGRLDLLRMALEAIGHDRRARACRGTVVLLGDYVDRGPQSREVVELLMPIKGLICLKGNHEAMMVAVLSDGHRRIEEMWMRAGGAATLKSYGASSAQDYSVVPPAHCLWLAGLAIDHRDDHRIYVHAGIEPNVRLADQQVEPKLWIRGRFLRASADQFPEGLHVVHGHTPQWRNKPDASQPELLSHRTNLDTGAYRTGVLTVGVFADDRPGGPVELITLTT